MKKEYIFAAVSILCWGTVSTVSKLLVNEMDSMFALAFSFLWATVFLLIYNAKCGYLKKLKDLSLKTILKMIGVGSLGVIIYNMFLLEGTARMQAQVAFVINYLWPSLIIIFSFILLKEKMSLGKLLAVLFSFVGIIVAVTGGSLQVFKSINLAGAGLCIMAAVSYALYSTLNKKEDYDKNLSVLISYASGAVIAFIWILVSGKLALPANGKQWAGLAINGIICNGLPYLTWAFALDIGNTAIIANLAYLTPFVSLLVTHFVLGEKITIYSVAGLLLIIAGIVIQFIADKRKPVTI